MRRFVLVFLSLMMPAAALAQFRLPRRPRIEVPIRIPGLDKILKQEPALATSLDDARTEVPFLDDFDPKGARRIALLPRGPNGGFLLVRPGLYEYRALGYCLHAGRHGPGEGDGYVYAPLRGPLAPIIHNVLHNSIDHPEVPQRDVQVLVWAILARSRIADLAPNTQAAARALLTAEEIAKLNGGALGLIPEAVRQRVFANLPPLVRQALDAEATLRDMLRGRMTTFEELEGIAVLTGDAGRGPGSRDVPEGRWSYHPDGFFVRYFPTGYTRNRIQVYSPQRFEIERDELGRITSITDQYRNRVETAYDDAVEPLEVPGDAELHGYAFRSIRFVRHTVFRPDLSVELKGEWEDVGWTLVGVPGGRGRVQAASERYMEAGERYQWAQEHKQQMQALSAQFSEDARERMAEGGLQELVDLGHYAVALRDAIGDEVASEQEWIARHVNLPKEAWQFAVCRIARGYEEEATAWKVQPGRSGAWAGGPVRLAAHFGASPVGADRYALLEWSVPSELSLALRAAMGAGGEPEFDPSEGAGMPGNTSKQREGSGGPSDEDNDDCKKARNELQGAKDVRAAYERLNPADFATGADLDQAVKDYLNEQLAQEGKPPLDQGNQPMGTHPGNCRLGPGGAGSEYDEDWSVWDRVRFDEEFGEYIKGKYFGGEPDGIFDAARAHEQVHQDKCQEIRGGGGSYTEWSKDPANHRQDELDAYAKQIADLEKWIKDNCK